MQKSTDVKPQSVSLHFLPIETRVPLKFGPETLTYVTCARACVRVEDRLGNAALRPIAHSAIYQISVLVQYN